MHAGEVQIEESDDEQLLGVTREKASQKFHGRMRISIYMEPKKLKFLMKAFASPSLAIAHLFRCSTIALLAVG